MEPNKIRAGLKKNPPNLVAQKQPQIKLASKTRQAIV